MNAITKENFEKTALCLMDGILDIIAYWPKDHILMMFGSALGTQLYEAMIKRNPSTRIPPTGVVET